MTDLPRGTVTFLFTDIEGSTRLWQEHPQAMASAIARRDALLREATEAQGGVVFKTAGDATCAAFASAPVAVAAALDVQRALTMEAWGEVGLLRVRMALHTGQAEPRDGDYRGQPLNRLSRLLAATHGGQVVLSLPTAELVREALPPGVVLRDLDDLPLKDLDRPERAVQVVHPDLQVTFPPPRVATAPSNNLPLPATPFLGREAEVAHAGALLRDPAVRLLTLTGPGGVGKTRLALRIAADLLNEFPDGVWFVGLAPISDPALVVPMVARVLGVREGGDDPLVERLGPALRDKRLLLVLDNFEQVVEAAPDVADLLATCPDLTVLVTSRIPLQLAAEHRFPVPPLSLPSSKGMGQIEEVARSEAVNLFVARAKAVRPDFAQTDGDAVAVAESVRRLDGLPLAIELAAARVAHLPPAALLGRLERRLPLLTGGPRDLPDRQRTIRNTIAWSYDLLSAEEQIVFRRLAVFVGGFTLEAAEAVATPGEVGIDVLEAAASLVDKSLLRQEAGPDGEPRYRMLETIREFALERLEAAGEAEAVRDRHAAHFVAEAEEAGVLLKRTDDPDVVERLEVDYPNLRATVTWLETCGEGETLLRVTAAIGGFWERAGHRLEGRKWAERALMMASEAPTSTRTRALNHAGLLAVACFDIDAAVGHLEQAAALARDLGLAEEEAAAVINLGAVLEDPGECDAAEAHFMRSMELVPGPASDAAELELMQLIGTYHLGVVAYGRGEWERARRLWEEALAGGRALEDVVVPAWCLEHLGLLAAEQGDLQRAAAALGQAWVLSEAVVQRHHRSALLAMLGVLGAVSGQAEAAVRLLAAADAAAAGRPFDPPEGDAYRRARERLRAVLGEAVYEHALAMGREQGEEAVDADARAVLAAATVAPTPAPVLLDPARGTGLTSRELDVLALLVEGRSNREIAEALFVSPRTVDNHVTNILAKLGAKSRTAAVAAARRLGLA